MLTSRTKFAILYKLLRTKQKPQAKRAKHLENYIVHIRKEEAQCNLRQPAVTWKGDNGKDSRGIDCRPERKERHVRKDVLKDLNSRV